MLATVMSLRGEVLTLYRRIFRLSSKWKNITASIEDSSTEKNYIQNEARTLFHKNKNLQNEDQIKMHIKEAETRVEMAIHYKMPYPRPMNLPQTLLPPTGKKLKKAQKRMLEQSKPLYLKSYDDT
ncbi:LYR motif-containing protein 1-like isoform X1 [Mytilus galloprovincialis]|uniref:LYR motif-containing protein 1-like isoform X1 n=1 Tax=Mytilus edulis TaxID=6550 RepID=UPI0039EE19A5